ncbi:MAG: dihydroorotate dehydrogenase electron transfer subunit [Candidatus Omnitrophica bacterium]|nr:dihydroorotate dehydrogenase electron transfer subunit [Candidatus Omnitrophota bacterium]
MIYQVKADIVKNVRVSSKIYRMELAMPKISSLVKPGQFIHLRINNSFDPLLRRPFSVNKVIKNKKGKVINICVLYEIVGKGTSLLAEKCSGDILDVLGPLGNGFAFNDALLKNKQIILVAGGMGIAPLLFLVERLKDKRTKNKPVIFIGSRTKRDLVCLDEFKKAGCIVKISTDDGSLGFKGYVSELVENFLTNCQPLIPNPYIYACGPSPMLKKVQSIASEYNLKGQVSLDEMMGCGIGACLGCVVKAKTSGAGEDDNQPVYKRICKDGPVFDIQDIQWED